MITNDLLTKFLQEELKWNTHTYCKSFEVFKRVIDVKISNKSNVTIFTGEIVNLERYQRWFEEQRDSKINQLFL